MQLTLLLFTLVQSTPSPGEVTSLLEGMPGKSSAPTVPALTQVDGVNVTQTSCTSKASLQELRDHFAKVFVKAGLYLPPEQDAWKTEVGTQLTGLDPEKLVSYTVLLQPSAKAVTVVMAAADVGAVKLDGAAAAEPVAPAMPGAVDVTTFKLEGITAMSYSVKASPAEIKAFYRATLKAGGWAETEEALTFVKGTQQLSVVVSPGVTERYVMVQLQAAEPR